MELHFLLMSECVIVECQVAFLAQQSNGSALLEREIMQVLPSVSGSWLDWLSVQIFLLRLPNH